MHPTLVRTLFTTALVALTALVIPTAKPGWSQGDTSSLAESDFDSSADRIHFDDLFADTELNFHLAWLGVRPRLASGPLIVVDSAATATVFARSSPLALRLGGHGVQTSSPSARAARPNSAPSPPYSSGAAGKAGWPSNRRR